VQGHAHWTRQQYTMSDGSNTQQLETVTVEKDLGVWINKDLKPTEQCIQATKKAQLVLGMIDTSR